MCVCVFMHVYEYLCMCMYIYGFPGSSMVKKLSAMQCRDTGLIPGMERYPGEGNGKPLQYSCLGIHMDRGDWRATVHGVAKSQAWLKWLCMHVYTCIHQFSCSVVSNSLWPHGLQHARLPCPSPTHGACSNSCPYIYIYIYIYVYVRIFIGFPICQWLFNQLISNETDNSYVSDWQKLQSFPIYFDGKFVGNVS